MVKKLLVSELVTDGALLLRELDTQHYAVAAMFWIYIPDQDYWRLIITSNRIVREGRASAYRRFEEILKKLPLSGLTLEDISLLEPNSTQFLDFFSLAQNSKFHAAQGECAILEDAVVYRWKDESIVADLSCEISAGQLEKMWTSERVGNNSAQLLFTVDKRRVTIRFHPRHGSLSGIHEIKKGFQIALHRPNVFPECRVTWLS